MGNAGLKQHCETAKKTGTLNLSRMKLDEFPRQLEGLGTFLRVLDLSENKFSKLPPDIEKFTLLKQLIVSGNRLVELPEVVGTLLKLETLNASSNQISALPNSLSNLAHLKMVNLSSNQLTNFPLMLCGLKHLDVLDLSHNKLTQVPDGVAGLYVTELNLNQNQISRLSPDLADCPRLKTLRLQENCLQLNAFHRRILEDSKISVLTVEGNLFEMRLFPEIEGYEKYMERYTACKKKLF
ncbi:hypothetical protein QAD02_004033 [Eretmocerus hayati]|uniref:Uncharacterized protein n=1 Tax=Eretmocerus hayati TaxID=131215 RepID=A0ACC2NNL6_9HYME|nr:hypothetical protein QAD02_004033 [Eretmocerus hayati]